MFSVAGSSDDICLPCTSSFVGVRGSRAPSVTRRALGRPGLVLVAFGILLTAALAWLWFVPSGTGEFLTSPDGRFTARASNLSRGTLTGRRDRYVQVQVSENASGRELWRVVRRPPGTSVPGYGNRDERFITWAGDSSSVTVPLGSGRRLVLEVP